MKHSIDWYSLLYWVVAHVRAVAATIGVTGVGVGFVKALRHAPAPREGSLWRGVCSTRFRIWPATIPASASAVTM
jgi:hypothetical protein